MSRDQADFAAQEMEQQLNISLQNQQQRAARHRELLSRFAGHCLNCEEAVEVGQFCDSDCQRDFEARTRARGLAPV